MNDEELTARFEKLEGMVNVLLQQIRNIQEGRVVAPEVGSSAPITPDGTAPSSGHATSRFIGPTPEVEQPQYIEDHPSVRPLDSRVTWGGGEYVRHGEVFTPQQPPAPLQAEAPAQQPLPAPPMTTTQQPIQPSPPPAPQPQQPQSIPAQVPVTNRAQPANQPPPEPTPQEQRQQRAAWRAEERRENIRSQGRQTNVDRMDEPYRAAYYDAAGVPEPPKPPAPRDALRAPRSGGDERLAEFAEVTASTLQIMQERLTLAMRQIEEMRNTFEVAAHE